MGKFSALPGGQPPSFAYRGYLVRSLLLGGFAVTKDGSHICFAAAPDEARASIDLIA